ncbi:MAG: ydfG [Ignavibacteria bacterium]|nr:ydfG [Ignavibacteria bacterium]
MLLKNKITLITGASSGIGRACAEVFAEAGSRLILLARRSENLNQLAIELNDKYATETFILSCDVRRRKDVSKALNLPDNWRPVDILINNAGLARGIEKIQEGKPENWDEMIDTNIKGLLNVTNSILPEMAARKNGIIINIASIAGTEAYIGGNVYCATKAAVKMLTKGMHVDLVGTGVRVTNIDPGLVETEFAKVRFHGDEARAAQVYLGYKPLEGRDVAEAALFCATRPKHVTIQDLMVTPTAQATTWLVEKNSE